MVRVVVGLNLSPFQKISSPGVTTEIFLTKNVQCERMQKKIKRNFTLFCLT